MPSRHHSRVVVRICRFDMVRTLWHLLCTALDYSLGRSFCRGWRAFPQDNSYTWPSPASVRTCQPRTLRILSETVRLACRCTCPLSRQCRYHNIREGNILHHNALLVTESGMAWGYWLEVRWAAEWVAWWAATWGCRLVVGWAAEWVAW